MDAAASGTLLSKIDEEAHRLLEEMSTNNCQWSGKHSKKVARIHEVDPIVSLSAQVSALASQISAFTTKDAFSSKKVSHGLCSSQSMEGVVMDPEQCQFVNNQNYNF